MSQQERAPAAGSTPPGSIPSGTAASPHWRGIVARVCTVLFAVLAALSVVTTWLSAELLNTDRYVATVSDLAADPAIQQAISRQVADQLVGYASTVVRSEQGDPSVVGSLTQAVSMQVIDRVVQDVVQSATFQQMWVAINRTAHPQVVSLLKGDSDSAIAANQGQVVLDLAPLVTEVQRRLSEQGVDLLNGLTVEPGVYTWVLFESDDLASAQSAVDLLVTLRWLLPVLAVAALVVAMILTSDRWREGMIAGLALALAMVLVLAALAIGRTWVLDQLDGTTARAAGESLVDILTEPLRTSLRYGTVVGLAVAGLVQVLRPASSLRAAIDRVVIRYRDLLYGGIVGAGCLVFIVQEQPSIASMVTIGVVVVVAVALVWWIARTGHPEPSTVPDVA